MSITEFIGFIVSLGALFFLSYRQAREEKKRRKDPEAYKQEQAKKQRILDDFMHKLEKSEYAHPEPLQEVDDEEVEEWEEESEVFTPHQGAIIPVTVRVPTHIDIKPISRLQSMITHLPNKGDLPILHAVFGPPKGFEP